MEVHFTPEQEARLAKLAASTGSSAEAFVHDAALRHLEHETLFLEADRGEFIEEEEMDARFQKMLQD